MQHNNRHTMELAKQIEELVADNDRLRMAMNDAIALLSDTDLHAEERAGNGMLCLATALNQT